MLNEIVIAPSSSFQEPKSVYQHTVEMSDDSMKPIFAKGDLLTINQYLVEEPGDYVLVRATSGSELHVIRRYTVIGDRAKYVPENPAYPAMLEDAHWANIECLGPVSAVRRVDGTVEMFDLSTRTKAEAWELGEQGWKPVEASLPKTA